MDRSRRLASAMGLGGVAVVAVAWGVVSSGLEPPVDEVRRPPYSYARAADL